MIFLGLGSNLDGPWGTPAQTIHAAIGRLADDGIASLAKSSLYLTSALGREEQPEFTNAVIRIESHLAPMALLRLCQRTEIAGGRQQSSERWAPRVLDIDILSHHRLILPCPARQQGGALYPTPTLCLPHPGIPERPFVLHPLEEIAPDWHHPVTGLTAGQMRLRCRSQIGGRIIARI